MSYLPEIEPDDLADWRVRFPNGVLIDVREPHEREISVLENDLHIPLGSFAAAIPELDPHQPTVVYCRTGNRSGQVVAYLCQIGFEQVWNLRGGINEYAIKVDPSMTTY